MDGRQHVYQGTRHYLPLDGLRGIAIFLVFWFHFGKGYWWTWLGWTGVDLFFVLSGFLITGILYDSLQKAHFFRTFYIRRSLRIFPLYFAFWALVLLAVWRFGLPWNNLLWGWLLYLGNWTAPLAAHMGLVPDVILTSVMLPFRAGGGESSIAFGHFWSLCVEEQYYLVWPSIVWMVRDRRRLIWICVAGIVLMPVLRYLPHALHMNPALVYSDFIYKSSTRVDELLMGSALALVLRGPRGLNEIRNWPVYPVAAAALVVFLISAIHFHNFQTEKLSSGWLVTYGFTLVGIVATAVLIAALRVEFFKRMLVCKPILELGRVSYGFYMLHLVPLLFRPMARYHLDRAWWIDILWFLGIWALSWFSFHFYEMQFLQLKNRWAPAH